jgi:hypothetical protein
MFIHQFNKFYNDFKITCFNLKLNATYLNSSLVLAIYPNLNFFNCVKSKYILLYSKTDKIFSILDYIKANNHIKIFALSFKNHFVDLA